MSSEDTANRPISFETDPSRYRHWKISMEGPVARLTMAVQEREPLRPGYELKLNSYDLGVDIELADAVQRLRFEHPEVRCVVITSARDRVFCAGANIHMLASSAHGFKVNFCKFTNETRLAIEDASRNSGQRYLAALNGTCAGGGYELALACDEIVPGGRRQLRREPARDSAAGRAPRHRRADAPGRQAEGAARSGRRLLHGGRGDQGQAGAGVAARGRRRPPQPVRRVGGPQGPGARGGLPGALPAGRSPGPPRQEGGGGPDHLRPCLGGNRPGGKAGRPDRARACRGFPCRRRRHPPDGLHLVALRGLPRAGRRAVPPEGQRRDHRLDSPEDRGGPGANGRPGSRRCSG